MPAYDFANLLLAGPCNARCPFCIGRSLPEELIPGNLHAYPPRNLERWLALVRRYAIRQVVVTGANTDPLLYPHHENLLKDLRRALPPTTQLSIHTNGRLADVYLEALNQYDRVALSLPSFEADTYRSLMGVPGPPDLAALLKKLRTPLKLSCVVTEANTAEIPAYLARGAAMGIRRVVLRKLYGETRPWVELLPSKGLDWQRVEDYRDNPVYALYGMQVTLWDFERTTSRSLNLFSSGLISREYRLARRPKLL